MDDTLYDEIDYYKSGFNQVSHQIAKDFKIEIQDVFKKIWEIFNKGNQKTTFDAASKKLGIQFDKSYIDSLIDIFRNHKPDITLPSESKQVLTDLKKQYSLGLITDGWLPGQEYKVKSLGLEEFFECIIYTEKLGTEFWKPSPKAFERLLIELDILASQCVYVGDNLEKDFISPNRLGFKTIRVVRERRIHFGNAPNTDAQANYEIDSIAKLPDLLRNIDAL